MSYATIEEAWGGLGPAPETPPPPQRRRERVKPKKKPPRGPKPAASHGMGLPTLRDGQAFVQAVFAKYGIGGVKELLGQDISSRLCGHRKNTRKNDLWSLNGPMTFEKTLLILAVLFGGAIMLNALFKPSGIGGGGASPPPW